MMKKRSLLTGVLVVLMLSVAMMWYSHRAAANLQASLERLIEKADWNYEKRGNTFLIPFTVGGERYVIAAVEKELGPRAELRVAYLFCANPVVEAGPRPSAELLREVARINDQLLVGNLGMNDEGDVIFNSSFWLRNADEVTLQAQVAVVITSVKALRERLKPYAR